VKSVKISNRFCHTSLRIILVRLQRCDKQPAVSAKIRAGLTAALLLMDAVVTQWPQFLPTLKAIILPLLCFWPGNMT